jgi:AcrR family transcriptional regulator
MKRHRSEIRGRPRSEAARAAILDAALASVREVGYDALAIEAVATRAGVAKTTVYRHWPTKEALVAAAVERVVTHIAVPDTGTIGGDLRALVDDALALYRDPATAALLSGLVAAMARSERIARAVREGFLAVRRDAILRVLRRGMARGELRPDLDADLDIAVDLLRGPLFFRALVTGEPIDGRALVDVVLRGIAAE